MVKPPPVPMPGIEGGANNNDESASWIRQTAAVAQLARDLGIRG